MAYTYTTQLLNFMITKKSGNWTTTNSVSTTNTSISDWTDTGTVGWVNNGAMFKAVAALLAAKAKIDDNYVGEVILPDGAILKLDKGKYEIVDKDAEIIYKANRIREFNRYINASDLLEEFIQYLGNLGLTKVDVLKTPIELFILWLIISAAEQDEEEEPQQEKQLLLEAGKHLRRPRCRSCGRFIEHAKAKAQIMFCSGVHMDNFLQRRALSAA